MTRIDETTRRVRPGYSPPLGLRGLPNTLDDLDVYGRELVARIRSAGANGVGGEHLAREMGLAEGARSVRLLVSYLRLAHGVREIISMPGRGYALAEHAGPEAVRRALAYYRHQGRCYFAIASVVKGQGIAQGVTQLVLDFMRVPTDEGERHDELAALLASEGATVADVVAGLVDHLRETEAGREALSRLGREHADVLLPSGEIEEMQRDLARMQQRLHRAQRNRSLSAHQHHVEAATKRYSDHPTTQRNSGANHAQEPAGAGECDS
jgi:hypothetical protein